MSQVEINKDGIRIPTWVTGVLIVIAFSWMTWMSSTVISTEKEIIELRAQVKSTAVPEGTEKALAEIRNRMNAELTTAAALSKLATENAKDISYLAREIDALKNRNPRP